MTETKRHYEVTIVFRPEVKTAEVIKSLTEVLGEEGKIVSDEELTLKKLAYAISGTLEAPIHKLSISGTAQAATTLSASLRLDPQVLRWMVETTRKQDRGLRIQEVDKVKKEVNK